jgi:hypothetical protein
LQRNVAVLNARVGLSFERGNQTPENEASMTGNQLTLTLPDPGWRNRLDWFLASQGQGFNAQAL